jgi:RNA 2',3'-cyclic 3'-phosphodiesterase
VPDEGRTTLRTFFAVELPDAPRARVAERLRRLRAEFPDVRASWEKTEKLHVTLKFIGEVGRARVDDLKQAAAGAVEGVEPFDLSVEGAGSFPPHGNPRVLWLGIRDASGRLALIHNALETACASQGFPRDRRPFKPHITLARIRSPQGARDLAAAHREAPFEPQRFQVSELILMRSELGPGGSRYTPLSRHVLTRPWPEEEE